MDLSSILIQVISGAVGGNLGGLLNKAKSLGPLMNTVLVPPAALGVASCSAASWRGSWGTLRPATPLPPPWLASSCRWSQGS